MRSKGGTVLSSTENLLTLSGQYSACSASDAIKNTTESRGLI